MSTKDASLGNESATWNVFWSDTFRTTQQLSWHRVSWEYAFEEWDRKCQSRPGMKVVEVGAGAGRMAAHFARRGCAVTLLDFSSEGLDLARQSFAEQRLNAEYLLADCTNMPHVPSDQYDIVTSGGLLEHFVDPEPVIQEMVRVAKPGGLIIATVITKKISVQTLGDIQIFCLKVVRDFFSLHWRGIISRNRRNFPFYENSIPLSGYRKILERAGCDEIFVSGASPFPSIWLPHVLRPWYGRLMIAAKPWWRMFNESQSLFAEIWGAMFIIHGRKRRTT